MAGKPAYPHMWVACCAPSLGSSSLFQRHPDNGCGSCSCGAKTYRAEAVFWCLFELAVGPFGKSFYLSGL